MTDAEYVVVIFMSEGHGAGCTLNRCAMEAIAVNSREEAEPIMERYKDMDPHFLRVRPTTHVQSTDPKVL